MDVNREPRAAARVEVEIDELVIDGLTPAEGNAVAVALRDELARRLVAWRPATVALEHLDAGELRVAAGARAGSVGGAIGRKLAAALAAGTAAPVHGGVPRGER